MNRYDVVDGANKVNGLLVDPVTAANAIKFVIVPSVEFVGDELKK
jgi:hypothetical protein